MAPTGSACQASVRWVMTPLAASPASFQPSKAAMITGALSLLAALSSIARHLLPLRAARLAMPPPAYVVTGDRLLPRLDWDTYDEHRLRSPPCGAGGAGGRGRRGNGDHAP